MKTDVPGTSPGQIGTIETPICDLILDLMSRGMSPGQAVEAARSMERIIATKSNATIGKMEEKRIYERVRKAQYRARVSQDLSQNVPGTGVERVLLSTTDESERKKNKNQTPIADVPRDKSDWPTDYREQFWKRYPRKTEKKAALAKLEAICKSAKVPWAVFIAGVDRYCGHVTGHEERYIKHPTTWLNKGCWDDEHGGQNARPGENRTVAPAGSPAPRNDPILAGMGNIADRIAQRKLAEESDNGTGRFSFDLAPESGVGRG